MNALHDADALRMAGTWTVLDARSELEDDTRTAKGSQQQILVIHCCWCLVTAHSTWGIVQGFGRATSFRQGQQPPVLRVCIILPVALAALADSIEMTPDITHGIPRLLLRPARAIRLYVLQKGFIVMLGIVFGPPKLQVDDKISPLSFRP